MKAALRFFGPFQEARKKIGTVHHEPYGSPINDEIGAEAGDSPVSLRSLGTVPAFRKFSEQPPARFRFSTPLMVVTSAGGSSIFCSRIVLLLGLRAAPVLEVNLLY